MNDDVRAGFLAWTEQFEGATDWLYLDAKGLVTIGFGNLVDPASMLRGLDFVRLDGAPASASEVSAAWLVVKGRKDLALAGGLAFKSLTKVRATRDSIATLCDMKLETFDAILGMRFSNWDLWPSSCQQAALSMAWAMGPYFCARFPSWCAACQVHDWATAAEQCHMNEDGQNDSFRRRNAANRALFLSAAA